jgi:hypothetical protein
VFKIFYTTLKDFKVILKHPVCSEIDEGIHSYATACAQAFAVTLSAQFTLASRRAVVD